MPNSRIVVSAFYKFVALEDFEQLRELLSEQCVTLAMRGSILLAPEGINGTIAGSRESTDALFAWIRSDPRLHDLVVKESFANAIPFLRMKVRLKKEIVTFRQPVDPTQRVGTYVDAQDWNELISDPEVLVIDTRNVEEIELGTFTNAANPQTESFTEFADYVATLNPQDHPRVAMFCTGGIRCEKASSYLLDQGFADVSHLKGGILKYLETVDPDESLWQGECFVFDERVSVDHQLEAGDYSLCRGCRHPIAPHEKTLSGFEAGVSCHHCVGDLTEPRAERLRERHHQIMLGEARGVAHMGHQT